MLLKSDGAKVMGKCDFQAQVVHVCGWSSRGGKEKLLL